MPNTAPFPHFWSVPGRVFPERWEEEGKPENPRFITCVLATLAELAVAIQHD